VTWKPGESGNPAGRPLGTGKAAELRTAIAQHMTEIVTKLVAQAKAGDTGAARLLLERVLPALRPVEQAAPIELPDGTLTEQGRAVMLAAGIGVLSPTQAAQLLTSLGTLAKLVEQDELVRRIEALEKTHAKT
jgi:hypothetical protein